MIKWLPIGFDEALDKTLENISSLGMEMVSIDRCTGRISSDELPAKVDSPSIDASLKDGYAVQSNDIINAKSHSSVPLNVVGSACAGGSSRLTVTAGQAVRILTGAKIPDGADAVIAEEFVQVEGDIILAGKNAEPGRNILPRGTDVLKGQSMIKKGEPVSPGLAGLLAAAGYGEVPVFKRPRVAIIATGDEVVLPGRPLPDGKLYASNMVTLGSFCRHYGMETSMGTAKDTYEEIGAALENALSVSDAILTSGGAWTGDRDLMVKVLGDMGWTKVFHRIRIGPGKAVGFGILKEKPVFILPGGPPSNLMGFLQIALPGLLKLSGHTMPGLSVRRARLSHELYGRDIDWTQFVFGCLKYENGIPVFHSLRQKGRLQSMAQATAVAIIPEGKTKIPAGSTIPVQILHHDVT